MKTKFIPNEEILEGVAAKFCDKLQDYVYVNELDDLKEGCFIRMITKGALTSPCIFCEIKISIEDKIQLFCRSVGRRPRFFHVEMGEDNLIFRKKYQ